MPRQCNSTSAQPNGSQRACHQPCNVAGQFSQHTLEPQFEWFMPAQATEVTRSKQQRGARIRSSRLTSEDLAAIQEATSGGKQQTPRASAGRRKSTRIWRSCGSRSVRGPQRRPNVRRAPDANRCHRCGRTLTRLSTRLPPDYAASSCSSSKVGAAATRAYRAGRYNCYKGADQWTRIPYRLAAH